MHDIKWIRENPEEFNKAMSKRNLAPIADEIMELDEEKRQLVSLIQKLQFARNEKTKIIAQMKVKNSPEFNNIKRDVGDIKEKLDQLENQLNDQTKLDNLLSSLPNIPDNIVPIGKDENDNVEIRKVGEVKNFTFSAKEHWEIAENLGYLDFTQTAKISGSRFNTLKGPLSRLERALANFMLDIHTGKFGYTEMSPPFLVRDSAMYGVGQLPKFAEDSFQTTNNYRLIPTAEVSLTNMVADSIMQEQELPHRFTAYSPCFRQEAGSAGRDTRGIFRQHQFNKVELVSITTPEQANEEHERMTGAAEEILKLLELPYRVMLLCSGDMGFSARKTYDIEVWLPGQNKYREISSCSNCGDFQARRMKARFRSQETKETVFVHTLNGSGLALGRTIVAIIENYQNEDGTINIPEILVPYMGGMRVIK